MSNQLLPNGKPAMLPLNRVLPAIQERIRQLHLDKERINQRILDATESVIEDREKLRDD